MTEEGEERRREEKKGEERRREEKREERRREEKREDVFGDFSEQLQVIGDYLPALRRV